VVLFTARQFAASATAVEVAADVVGVCVVLAVKVATDTEFVDDEVVALATGLQDRRLLVISPIHNEQKNVLSVKSKIYAVIDDA
jgi:Na+-transporting NADH:ubiquinone oxidoreductase subunit NqrD